jgi:CheY-like chemotaxis protein
VLIVDDNATNREILTTRLTAWGMRPAEVPNGEQALEALSQAVLEKDPYRLALVDMQMPVMDGEVLGCTIRADQRLAGIRMVMLTSLGTRGDARRFATIGFAAYLTKPLRHQELKEVLALVMGSPTGAESVPLPIVTRHTARELRNRFAGHGIRILLAEDNPTNQQVALGILRNLGLTAEAVANGAEAIRALEAAPYDLVLMDVQMPVLDGLAATRQIRDDQTSVLDRTIPIIAMTAHAMQGDREKCLAAGMSDYLTKPVKPRELVAVMEKWLPGKPWGRRAEASEAATPALFDRAAMLDRLLGDETLLGEVLEGFLGDIPRQIEALKACLTADNAPEAERLTHTIKGAAANVGAEQLRALAMNMEMVIKKEDLDGARAQLGELDRRFETLREEIRKRAF